MKSVYRLSMETHSGDQPYDAGFFSSLELAKSNGKALYYGTQGNPDPNQRARFLLIDRFKLDILEDYPESTWKFDKLDEWKIQ